MHLLSSIIRLLDYGCRHKTIRNAKISVSCLRRNFIAWNLAPGIFLENKGVDKTFQVGGCWEGQAGMRCVFAWRGERILFVYLYKT